MPNKTPFKAQNRLLEPTSQYKGSLPLINKVLTNLRNLSIINELSSPFFNLLGLHKIHNVSHNFPHDNKLQKNPTPSRISFFSLLRKYFTPLKSLKNASLFCPYIILILLFLFITPAFCDEIDDLIPFIIKVESNGNPNAVSPQGCVGLLQVNPNGALKEYNEVRTGEWATNNPPISDMRYFPPAPPQKYQIADLFDIKINIKVGTWYLRRLKDHYIPQDKYSIDLLCACYNAGPTRMRKVNWDISKAPKETRSYVRKVLKLYKESE